MSITLVVTRTVVAHGTSNRAQSLTFNQPRIVIGRGTHADVRLPSRGVSDTHAIISLDVSELSIIDEGSTNGTAVNGQPMVRGRRKVLRPTDRISVPGFEIAIEASMATPDPPERTATVARKLLLEGLSTVGGEAVPPELVLGSGKRAGQVWKLPPSPARLIAGRGETCEVILDDVDCSRHHVEFARDEDGVILRDLGSKNGVFVGERRVTERRLRDGDEIRLGRSALRFNDPTDELLRAFEGGVDESAALTSARPSAPPSRPASSSPGPAEVVEAGVAGPVSSAPVTAGASAGVVTAPSRGASESGSGQATTGRPLVDRRRKPKSRAADWVVVAFAVIILGVSMAALYFLLHGAPGPTAR